MHFRPVPAGDVFLPFTRCHVPKSKLSYPKLISIMLFFPKLLGSVLDLLEYPRSWRR